MKLIMRTFFPPQGQGPSFCSGVRLVRGKENLLATARFAGWLADEKALNSILDATGASGTKCCIHCNNIFQRVNDDALGGNARSIACTDVNQFHRNDDQTIYDMYDCLREQRPHLSQAQYRKMCQYLGLKLNPHGVLADEHLRTIVRPATHTIHDWMHMILNGGVANIQAARVLELLMARGIKLELLQNFAATFILPAEHGKIKPQWFHLDRLGKDRGSLKAFASEMTSILVILESFMDNVVKPEHGLHDHVLCLRLLCKIVGILRLGPKDVMQYMDVLQATITDHGEMFVKLYTDHVKPKFHYLRHLKENADHLKMCLSCFVTERKHRITKRVALYTFRGIDNAVIRNLVFRQCEAFKDCGSGSLFHERCLVEPREVSFGETVVLQARRALLTCGAVAVKDVVALATGEIGRVVSFWGFNSSVVGEVEFFERLSADVWRVAGVSYFVDVAKIERAVVYAPCMQDCIRVLLPARSKYFLA